MAQFETIIRKAVGLVSRTLRHRPPRSRRFRGGSIAGEVLELRCLLTDPIAPVRNIDERTGVWGEGLGSSISEITVVGDLAFFFADDGQSGKELWKTDGTNGETSLVRDILPGPGTSRPRSLIAFGNQVAFVADNGSSGFQLWISNGTDTHSIVLPFATSEFLNANPTNLTVIDDLLYFTAGHDAQFGGHGAMYRTDGTTPGTQLITPEPGPPGSPAAPEPTGAPVKFQSRLYFPMRSGSEIELWTSDGTAAGTQMFADINPFGSSNPADLTVSGNSLYFTAEGATPDGTGTGRELWVTDGTIPGTQMLADIMTGPGTSEPRELTDVNGVLYLTAVISPGDRSAFRTLWRSTGIPETTEQVAPFTTMNNPKNLFAADGTLYFSGLDDTGNELWSVNSGGIRQIKDIAPGTSRDSSDPSEFILLDGAVYFAATAGSGRELWRTNGTKDGTQLVLDITGDDRSSEPTYMVAFKHQLLFAASTVKYGTELYAFQPIVAPATPVILGPTGTTRDNRPVFRWSESSGASQYELWISCVTTKVNPLIHVTLNGSTYQPEQSLGIGLYRVWVRAVNSGGTTSNWSEPVTVRINTSVTLSGMAKQQNTARPTVAWNALPGAVFYDLWLDNVSTGTSQVARNTRLTATTWSPPSDLPLGRYRVWVRGIDADGIAASWSAFNEFDDAMAPVPTSPIRATFNSRPTFTWNAVNGALQYDVYLRDVSTGVNTYYVRGLTNRSWTPPSALPTGALRWWVQARSAQGVQSLWSAPVNIWIGGRTSILSPIGVQTSRKPTFSWQTVDGAGKYELWVNNVENTQRVLYENALKTTSFTPATALASGTYRVWVRAISTSGVASLWSIEAVFAV